MLSKVIHISYLVASLSLAVILSCTSRANDNWSRFQGMWKLDCYEALDSATHQWQPAPARVGYSGYLLYDGASHVAVQLHPPNYKGVDNMSGHEGIDTSTIKTVLSEQLKTFEYAGAATIDDQHQIIQHHIRISNHLKEVGTTVTRKFEFRGDTLILTAMELIGGHTTRLRWTKSKN